MSDSRPPHELQPTRLLCPWHSPGKKTGVASTSSSRGTSLPGIELASSALASAFFATEPLQKPLLSGGQESKGLCAAGPGAG